MIRPGNDVLDDSDVEIFQNGGNSDITDDPHRGKLLSLSSTSKQYVKISGIENGTQFDCCRYFPLLCN